MAGSENRDTFYPRVVEALIVAGYEVADRIQGLGRQHASKPDYIAVKGDWVVIGEIKSPAEGPLSGSWRVPQASDTPEFAAVRLEVENRERRGLVTREAGGHEIIIRGQIPDYRRKLGKTYALPAACAGKRNILGGYSAPASQAGHIELSLRNCSKAVIERISHRNGTVTYIFPL
jgi:hypothetical protein